MKLLLIVGIAIVAGAPPPAAAGHAKDIQPRIVKANRAVDEACGCTITFSWSKRFDFTSEHGRQLAYNTGKAIETVGESAVKWCKRGDDHRDKLCTLIRNVEIDQDPELKRPYVVIERRGAIRSFIATKNPKQMSIDGGGWVELYLRTGKVRPRPVEDQR